ncbi:MAG: GNAT family N-acetyltransferase [Butyrivibrio sp.]|nr:GNAT family N-acetyltransferase [Butyrivibrio sp.]
MNRITITKKNLNDFESMIPRELHEAVAAEKVSAIGMKFSGMEAGAAVWTDNPGDDYGTLLSLFVPPEFRGLDVGHCLLQEAIFDMGAAKKAGITFKYEDEGQRRTLTPFFNSFGFRTDVFETPLGRITLKEASDRIESTFGKVEQLGEAIKRLGGDDQRIASEYITSLYGAESRLYFSSKPDSFIIIDKGKAKGVLLFSEEEETVLSLDYAFSKSPKHLAGLLKYAIMSLSENYAPETKVEMLLTTPEGMNLFKGLFGEANDIVRIARCRQSFKTY